MACCSQMMTFEEVDKHLDAHAHIMTAAAPIDSSMAALQICPAYKAVKPVLTMILSIPFFPAKWKNAVKSLMSVLDMICP